MKPTAYKIGEGERKGLSKDMQEVILAYEEENRKLKDRIRELELCNLNIQTWIDNKEKVNKSMREDIKWYEKEEDRLREEIKNLKNELMEDMKTETKLNEEKKKLKNSIEYRKKKAESNQEKANQIDKIMNLPGVMVDGKIDWSKVAVYYIV